jgi:hypothetical protein
MSFNVLVRPTQRKHVADLELGTSGGPYKMLLRAAVSVVDDAVIDLGDSLRRDGPLDELDSHLAVDARRQIL